jgi:hypothetical protein
MRDVTFNRHPVPSERRDREESRINDVVDRFPIEPTALDSSAH